MGSCCVADSSLIGEQFIRDILSDEAFKLRNYTYMELLNEIVSKRVEQEIPKEHVKQYLFPEFYDADKSRFDSNDVYINSIFSYILDHLEEKNNMYLVLLYFYPFIKHEEEKKHEIFFNTIRFITQSHKLEINREQVRQWIFQYISFCSWGITYAIRIKMPPSDDMNKSIKSLLKGCDQHLAGNSRIFIEHWLPVLAVHGLHDVPGDPLDVLTLDSSAVELVRPVVGDDLV